LLHNAGICKKISDQLMRTTTAVYKKLCDDGDIDAFESEFAEVVFDCKMLGIYPLKTE